MTKSSTLAVRRLSLAAAVAAFGWWAGWGAADWFAARSYDEAATWTELLSRPWLAAGLIAGGAAVWRPTRWTVGVFAAIWLIHIALVALTW